MSPNILREAFAPIFFAKKLQSQTVNIEKLLVKFCFIHQPCVNFTNVLCAAFMLVDPKSVKSTVKSLVSFYAFRICVRKSCMKNVDKIEPL